MIDTDVQRKHAFWTYCLPDRIALASLATIASLGKLRYLEFVVAVAVLGLS
tara:strand:- start:2574 stop:2726 length:153 start_codon:yes stop_codon:yes gene_type:complete